MKILDEINSSFPTTKTVFQTVGSDNTNGILSCGFIRKQGPANSEMHLVFKHYGALLLLEGYGEYIDYDGSSISLHPGCYIQRLPDRKHCTLVGSDCRWLETYICFGREIYLALEKAGAVNIPKPVLKPGLDYLLIQKFLAFYQQLKDASVYQLPALIPKAQEIMFYAYELDQKASATSTTEAIEVACKIIDEDITRKISGIEIAQQLDIGYENFRKLFKAQIGLSPKQYIIQKRMNMAKSLLQTSDNKLSDIAQALGYTDLFEFSKQFKKHVGKSPTEFRRQI